MQGGLAAYGFIGNQGAQGLRAEHPWKGPRLSTKEGRLRFDHRNQWALGLGARHPFPRSGSVHA
jgi:hypothetical protein